MSEEIGILTDMADRLFRELAEAEAGFDVAWPRLEEMGFPLLLVAEDDGGFGGRWSDAFAVLRLAGYHTLAAPLGDSVAASWTAHLAGLSPVEGLTTIGAVADGTITDGAFTGAVRAVPCGRAVDHAIVSLGDKVIRLRAADARTIDERTNPAGEARDTLHFTSAVVEIGSGRADPWAWAALARTALIAGVLDAALETSMVHANDRSQFGRSIGKFQAIQQALAEFAEEAAAVNCAGQAAARAASSGDGDASAEIAAAKIRAGDAAAVGVRVAHQVHGAIGFTLEHRLHHLTTRLTSWRSEFGNERHWALWLGRWSAAHGGDGLWSAITARTDHHSSF